MLGYPKKSGISGVIVKLDIEKAHARVYWNVSFNLMERMGFGEKWGRWISSSPIPRILLLEEDRFLILFSLQKNAWIAE